MQELLQKLFSSEILTEDTRVELKAVIEQHLTEAKEAARKEVVAEVTQQMTERYIQERDLLIEALDSKATAFLTEELDQLRSDIDRFRDLETEHAQKLVEAKQQMSKQVKTDIKQLIESLDTFLEVRLTAELSELRDDIAAVKKQEFGRKIFEGFVAEFKQHYTPDNGAELKLAEAEQLLAQQSETLKRAKARNAALERAVKMEQVLQPLAGRSREVMEAILKTVDTSKLEETYTAYVGRVLKEASAPAPTQSKSSEKESGVLAEGAKSVKPEVKGVVRTGDTQAVTQVTESVRPASTLSETDRERLRRAAGLK